MTRTVKVELEANVAGFLGGVLEAERATGKLDDKVEALDHDLNKLGRDAVETGAEVGILGGAAKETSGEVYELGKRTEETGKKTAAAGNDTKAMRARMDELKDSLKTTGAEFAKNADPDLLKKFKADSSELSGLESMVKKMGALGLNVKQLGQDSEKAESFLTSLKGGFEGGLTSPAVLGMGAAALGPALAAAGGAIGAIGGAAGAGLGIYGAVLGNPTAFANAWSSATGVVKKELIDAGAAFTGPTLAAIQTIGPTISSWHLDQALAPAAKYVPVLVSGLEKAATGFEHGFANLVASAGPEVQVLSDGMAQFGNAVGTAFSEIASGSQGGAQALHDTITLVSDLTIAIGGITGAAENAFGALHDHPFLSAIATGGLSIPISVWDAVAGSAGKASNAVTDAGNAAAAAGPDFKALSTELNKTKTDGDSLAETMSLKVLNSMLGIDRAALSFDQALLSVNDSVKQNGHSLDQHTAKGLANRQMILSLVSANVAEYQANVAAGAGAEEAAKAYDDGTAALERQLRKAGFTQAAIDGLIGKYKGVPKNVDTDIAINGLTDAINNLGDLIAQLNHIDGHNYHSTVTTDYINNTKSVYNSQVPSYSNVVPVHNPHPHAGGGMLNPGWNIVGEQGPELIRDGQVYTAAQTRSMMSTGWHGGSAGSGSIAVTLAMATGADLTPLGSLFNKMLRDGIFVVKASQVRQNV